MVPPYHRETNAIQDPESSSHFHLHNITKWKKHGMEVGGGSPFLMKRKHHKIVLSYCRLSRDSLRGWQQAQEHSPS